MSEPHRQTDRGSSNSLDAVIEVYKRDVDRSLLRETLVLTPDQRVRRLLAFLRVARELRRAMRDAS